MGHRIAIDFGTTNSVAARWDIDHGGTIQLPALSASPEPGMHLIPTLLYVRDGQSGDVVIGQAVIDGGFDRAPGNRLYRNFKRAIGSDRSEPRIIDGVPWTDFDAGKHFLDHLLKALPFENSEIEQLVITVPVAAFEGYTAWLSRALESFADRVRVVDESTAAALGYAVTQPGAIVLVIDFGGGTLDLSLVRLPDTREQTGKVLFTSVEKTGGTARVIAKAGVSLGGSDIDRWLMESIVHRSGLSVDDLGAHQSALLTSCERAKIALTSQESISFDWQSNRGSHHTEITRSDLEAIMEANGFYASLTGALEKVMGLAHQKDVYREDIGHILLVGGTSLVPSVQKTLDTFFRTVTEKGRRPLTAMPKWPALKWSVESTSIRADKPFTAVVEGALQVSAGFGLDDQLAHGYGLMVRDPSTEKMIYDEIIPMGSTYPTPKPSEIQLSASHRGQKEIALVIGQISAEAASGVEVAYEDGRPIFVAHSDRDAQSIVPINAAKPVIIKLDPAGVENKARISAEFRVDAARKLRVSVRDLKTRKILLVDHTIASLSKEVDQESKSVSIDGSEPTLIKAKRSGFSLSLAGLNSLFNMLHPDQVSPEVYAAALRSDDCMARYNAAEILSRRADREARLIFEDILETGEPYQRASAARHLYRFSWFTAESLFNRALHDSDPRVIEAAVFALCKMRQPESYRKVMEILESGTDALRMSAIWGLQTHPDAGAVPVLALALHASRAEIRAAALEVLGATGSPEAIPLVRDAINDPDYDVKYSAALSWIELARESCFADLAEVIEKNQGWDRYWILRGFFHASNYMGVEIADDRIFSALKIAQADSLSAARIAVSMPLAWSHHPRAGELLIQFFHTESDPDTRAHILSNAVNLMSPVASTLLEEADQSSDILIRQTAEYLRRK